MRGKSAGKRTDGDFGAYSVHIIDEFEQQPLLDLRTRLVLWILCLVFLGLVYWGLHTPLV